MTLKELLAIDEGAECPGCPVCKPPEPRRAGARSVRFRARTEPATFLVLYTDARTNRTREGATNPHARSVA